MKTPPLHNSSRHFLLLGLLGCTTKNNVSVLNDPPEVEILSPGEGDRFVEGEAVEFAAHIGDKETPDELTTLWTLSSGEPLVGAESREDSLVILEVAEGFEIGSYTIDLRVIDDDGEEDSDTVGIEVEPNGEPTLRFSSPTEGQRFADGLDISVSLDLADDQEGALALAWGDLAADSAVAPTEGVVGEAVAFSLPSPGVGEGWRVSVSGADALGATGSAEVSFSVENGDKDGDGYIDEQLGGDDCDDGNAEVHPDATEICNEIDDDCDGEIDEDAADASAWYTDADGDSWGAAGTEVLDCEAPEGRVGNEGDCDDSDAAVNPDAVEICEDGVDDDCDGTANDCGLDGLLELGVDDGVIFYAEDASDQLGSATGCPGDVDGDGLGDVVLGASGAEGGKGAVYLFWGRASWEASYTADTADLFVVADRSSDHLGDRLVGEDLDGAGNVDLLLAAPDADATGEGSGSIYLLFGDDLPATGSAASDLPTLVGEDNGDHAGQSLATGDVDGDGYGDALFGAPGYDSDETGAGRAYLLTWDTLATTESLDLAGADALFTATDTMSIAGTAVAIGDLDGDGYGELVIGAPGAPNSAGENAGVAFVVRGAAALTDLSLPADADASVEGAAANDEVGTALVVLPGDGEGALGIGGPAVDDPYAAAGRVWIFLGLPADADVATADTTITGDDLGDGLGTTLARGGDTDGDGAEDLLVGAPMQDSSNQGSTYLFRASAWATSGTLAAADADAWLFGNSGGSLAGTGLGGGGDADGDGYGDVLVGAPGENSAGGGAGAAYLLLGGGF